jgi:hypothetical protein
MAIFFQRTEILTPPRESSDVNKWGTRARLDALLEELKKPETTAQKRKELMKSVNQTQLLLLKEGGNEKVAGVLKWRETFESIRSIDLLSLRRQGVLLYEYLLFNTNGSLSPTKKEDLKAWEEFWVNFWVNKYMKDSVGAGDILPAEVTEVEINGKRAQRKNIWGRPGYYALEWKRWNYRPIYDGDTVKILATGVIDAEQAKKNKETEDSFFKQRAMEDILESIRLWKDPRKELSYLSDDEYKESFEYAEQIKKEREERASRMPKPKNESEFLKNYGEYLDSICAHFKIPQEVMMTLFRKETTNFSSTARNKDTRAHGIGQIVDWTWQEIQNKHLPSYGIHGKILDRNDIKDQILASVCYLRNRTDERGGSIERWLMGYFWVSWELFNTAKEQNKWVYKVMQENNLSWPEGFEKAYIIWLGLTPGNIPTAYNNDWKNQLPKEEYDTTGLPFWLNAKVTYENGDKVTWCGYTARENADNFGATFPPIYNSSQALSRYSGDMSVRTNNPTQALSHAKEAWANVLDIVFENSKWSAMWHRACAIIAKDGNCYVYDPYFALGRSDMRTAIPYDKYMTAMIQGEGKTLVWVWLHTSDHKALKQS